MLNQMVGVPRRTRRVVAVPANGSVVAPLGNWDRIEGKLGMVGLRCTKIAAAGQLTQTMIVGETTPVQAGEIGVERAVGAGPQIEDPVFVAAGTRNNRIEITFTNATAGALNVTYDVQVMNRG